MCGHRLPGQALPDGRIPVLLSAHDEDLIGQDAAAILNYLQREPSVTAVAATLSRTRRMRRHRVAVRAGNLAELAAGLRALAQGEEHPLVARSSVTAAARVAFVFPGQGNQWPSMGADAYEWLAAYRVEADRCAAAFAAAGLESPLPYLLTRADQLWSQIHIQGAQFIHAAGLAQVWRSCGVRPDITVGHSLGEVAAAYAAGAVGLPDAVAVVAARASVVEKLSGRYGMAVLSVGAAQVGQFIAEAPGWLEVSAINGPSSVVVAGDRDAVDAIVLLAEQRGIFARAIAVDYPGHTSALEPLRGVFAELLPSSGFVDTPVAFVSSACGAVIAAGTDFTDYWCQNLVNTVRFDHSVAVASRRGVTAFAELSAHPSLLSALADQVDESVVLVGSGRRDERITDRLSASIVATALADPGYRWADVGDFGGCRPLWGFPNAPMRAIRLWATPEPLPPPQGSAVSVAFEEWEARAAPEPNTTTRAGMALVGPDGPLTQSLTDAVAAHPGCYLAPLEAAEIVVVIAPALQHPDVIATASDIVSRREARLPDYAAIVGSRCRRVWLVTAGSEHVREAEPVALPGQAALAAMHRSVGFEFPDQTFGHLDLPSRDIDTGTAVAAVDTLLADCAEVALRGGPRPLCYTRRLRERREPDRPLEPAELDNVVITGGSGTIGRRYARHCIEHGARRVILLSRKGVDPVDLDRLVKGYRAEVAAPLCDIADPDMLSATAAEHAGDGASLLIHAAGAARLGTYDQLTGADLAAMFGAKVCGPARIADVWPLRHGVRMLLCSSVSGVWGGYGHAAYAAANRMLDVLAASLRAKGRDCVAVRWGLWQGTQIVGADEIARVERSGLVAMDPHAALEASLRRHAGDPLIFGTDSDRLRRFFESQAIPMPFGVSGDTAPAVDGDYSGGRPLAEVVRTELAAALSLGSAAAVDLNATLIDLGVDSLLALDLRKRLRRSTGRSVALARLLGGITGAELIDALQSSTEGVSDAEKSRKAGILA
jgi:mycobactin polyketide synthetase MbtD